MHWGRAALATVVWQAKLRVPSDLLIYSLSSYGLAKPTKKEMNHDFYHDKRKRE
jgi:hypothetical protein